MFVYRENKEQHKNDTMSKTKAKQINTKKCMEVH